MTAPAPLGRLPAIIDALRNRPIDFYPYVDGPDRPILLKTPEIMAEFGEASENWPKLAAGDDLDAALDLAADSLKEVKAQTEYQDQKATRLLTVTSFVMALAGALFTRLNEAYPITDILSQPVPRMALVGLAYAGFGTFLLFSLFGALVTFHATRTRFKYRQDGSSLSALDEPLSRLFYQGVVTVRPSVWSRAFVDASDPANPVLQPDLKQKYLRDLVGETYLVACKTAEKLRYLDPAQRLLATALKCLLAWLALLALLACIPKEKKDEAPTQVQLVGTAAPVPVKLVSTRSTVPVGVEDSATLRGPSTAAQPLRGDAKGARE